VAPNLEKLTVIFSIRFSSILGTVIIPDPCNSERLVDYLPKEPNQEKPKDHHREKSHHRGPHHLPKTLLSAE